MDKICGNRPDITGKILIKWGKNGLPAGRRADKNPEIERAERGVKIDKRMTFNLLEKLKINILQQKAMSCSCFSVVMLYNCRKQKSCAL